MYYIYKSVSYISILQQHRFFSNLSFSMLCYGPYIRIARTYSTTHPLIPSIYTSFSMCNIGQKMETCVVDIPNSSVWSYLFQLVIKNRGRPGCLAERGDLYSFVEQNLKSRRMQRLVVKNFTLSDRLGRQNQRLVLIAGLALHLRVMRKSWILILKGLLVYVSACLRVFCFLNHWVC